MGFGLLHDVHEVNEHNISSNKSTEYFVKGFCFIEIYFYEVLIDDFFNHQNIKNKTEGSKNIKSTTV